MKTRSGWLYTWVLCYSWQPDYILSLQPGGVGFWSTLHVRWTLGPRQVIWSEFSVKF